VTAFGETERMRPSDAMGLYTGNANPALAAKIGRYLGSELGSLEVFEFANENIFVRIVDNVREKDVFLIQPTSRPVQEWDCPRVRWPACAWPHRPVGPRI
jgi:hypothetical protein